MAAGYILGDEVLLNQLSVNQRNNTYWTIVYLRNGRGMYILEESLRSLNEGDVIILPPGVGYSFASEDLGDEYNINIDVTVLRFDSDWLNAFQMTFPVASDMVLRIREIEEPLVVHGRDWIRISSLLSEIRSCPEQKQPLRVFGILELLSERKDMSVIVSPSRSDIGTDSERIERIDRYLSCHFCSKLTLEQVSDYLGMSRTYFSIFFKSRYGEGFSDYLNRLRVEKSREMLALTSRPLPSIASECGFKTVQYYTRAFKRITGITPGAYRKEKSRLVHKDD